MDIHLEFYGVSCRLEEIEKKVDYTSARNGQVEVRRKYLVNYERDDKADSSAFVKNKVRMSILKESNYQEDYTKSSSVIKLDMVVDNETRDYICEWVNKYRIMEKSYDFAEDAVSFVKLILNKKLDFVTGHSDMAIKYMRNYMDNEKEKKMQMFLRKGMKATIKYDDNPQNDEIKIFPVCICKEVIFEESRENYSSSGDNEFGTRIQAFISMEYDQFEIDDVSYEALT